jgi:hypothetical protein
MQDAQKILFKNKLKQICKSLIEQRIGAAKMAIQYAQEAANSEEKSSAGDKYETSRAMSHLEKDMHSKQLAEILKELATLNTIDVDKICKGGEPGAYIGCSDLSFFIAAGMGKQIVDGQEIYFLSPKAPLATILHNKKAGDHFPFNHIDRRIVDVY